MSNIEKLEKRLEKEPSSLLFVQLAEEYRKIGRLDDAISVCLEGIRYHPNYWSAYVLLAKCYFEKQEFDKAREYLEEALTGLPDNIQAISLMADVYEKLELWDKALDKLKILQLLSPNKLTESKIGFIEGKIKKDEIEEPPTVQFSTSLIKEILAKGKETEEEILDKESSKASVSQDEISTFIKEEVERTAEIQSDLFQVKDDIQQENLGEELEESKIKAEEAKPVELISVVASENKTKNVAITEKEIDKVEQEDQDATTEISTQTLGEIYASQGYYDKAIKIYQKIVLAEPNNISAINRLKELLDEFNKINIKANKQYFKEEIIQDTPEKDRIDQKLNERKKRISTLENWLATIRKETK